MAGRTFKARAPLWSCEIAEDASDAEVSLELERGFHEINVTFAEAFERLAESLKRDMEAERKRGA